MFHYPATAAIHRGVGLTPQPFLLKISSCLGQNWQPLSADDVHESIYDHEVNESSAFLPILLEDQKSKLYC